MNFKNTILLTGAGFTANFGGFLAKEMWSKIFNNPKLNNAGILKLELRKNFDFEDLYSRVMGNRIPNLPAHEPHVFVESLNEAYLAMDKVIRDPVWEYFGVHPANLRSFLEFFQQSDHSEVAPCFTLNQDLFMERTFGWQPLGPTSMRYRGTFGNLERTDLDSDGQKALPTDEELEVYKSSFSENFLYVKLHGSQKWISSDGSHTKIIGINKRDAIEKVPLLRWYFALFEQALFRQNVKLVVIGYSFRDDHINACIAKAISEYGLKLYIISKEDPESFRIRIINKNYSPRAQLLDSDETGTRIWNAVEGYFPYELKRILPISQVVTAEKSELFQSIGIPLTR